MLTTSRHNAPAMDVDEATGSELVNQRLRATLHRLVARPDVRHAVLALQSGDGTFRWVGAAGDADPNGTPMRRDTPSHIASIQKLYTAAVIMQLYERRRVDLNASIASYLPQSLLGALHRMGGVDYTHHITVRNFLGHTSGLADCRVAYRHHRGRHRKADSSGLCGRAVSPSRAATHLGVRPVRGELFDDTATLALMQQRWNRFGLPRDAAALRAPGWPIEYGLGIMRFRLPRLFTGMRRTPAVIGHSGSTGAWLFYCDELDLLLAGTVN